ncbi:MAG: UvrD-helicase domain-containing protein [Bacteroidales bacterium]|nr:UvrD-helicase domain-containing protein [Bacteroidales bacterium]
MLKIYKASAGSGKTHRLTQEYLNLLFQSEQSFRHILAVTFTNKATEEMKHRIIQELDNLAQDPKHPRQEQARRLLVEILNDYTAFQVSTIDRFFQRVMRSFARELGQAANYNIELDQQRVLSEAVDEMMNNLEGEEELLDWLITLSVENIERGASWDATAKIKEMGNRLFSEEYKLKSREMEACLRDKPSIRKYREALEQLHDQLSELEQQDPNSLTEDQRKDMITASVILMNINVIALFADIREHLYRYCRENNLVLLSETNYFLNRLIGQDDTPFVYEKIGTRIRHYMLDEFQDTSTLQWKNFSPLLKDSLDNHQDNLVVGDVKQCIYRWRNSDWQLLNHKIQASLDSSMYQEYPIRENWRSAEVIVHFNNAFFSKAAEAVQQVYNKERGYDLLDTSPKASLIRQIFADVKQEVVSKNAGFGRVSLQFVDRERVADKDWKAAVLQRLPEIIEEILGRGFHLRDITLLVRKNKEGSLLAAHLLGQGYRVVTEESLTLSSSEAVLGLVGRLKQLSDQGSLPEDVSLYALCERLVRELSPDEHRESIFIRTFLDAVLEFTMGYHGGNIKELLTWWDETGCNRCVQAPEGEDALRILTVHKSKGLDAKILILPFLDELFSPRGNMGTYLWVTPQKAPFNMLPILPLPYNADLKNSWFSEDYWKERQYYLVDLLNVAYVAFTRAKEEMIILSAQPKIKKKGDYSINSLSNLLYSHYDRAFLPLEADDRWKVLEIGQGRIVQPQQASEENQRLKEEAVFRSIPIGNRLQLSLQGADFFSGDSDRTRGVVMHKILSRVEKATELSKSIHIAVMDGELAQADVEAVTHELRQALERVRDQHWFDGTYQTYNEMTILDQQGQLVCPDRVMVKDKQAIVLDYKFGHVESGEYVKQVRRYLEKVSQMGWNVKGYLWYVSLNKVILIEK